MKVRLIGERSQFEVCGLMRKPCQRGSFLQFDLDILRAKDAPDDEAGIGWTVLPPAEAKIDYLTPEVYLDGEKIDHRAHFFKVSTDVPRKLIMKIFILQSARWFPEFIMDVDVTAIAKAETS